MCTRAAPNPPPLIRPPTSAVLSSKLLESQHAGVWRLSPRRPPDHTEHWISEGRGERLRRDRRTGRGRRRRRRKREGVRGEQSGSRIFFFQHELEIDAPQTGDFFFYSFSLFLSFFLHLLFSPALKIKTSCSSFLKPRPNHHHPPGLCVISRQGCWPPWA